MKKQQNDCNQGLWGFISSIFAEYARLFANVAFFTLVLNALLFPVESEKRKVVYINIEEEGDDLPNIPFFTGLTIEEAIEAPSIDFNLDMDSIPLLEIGFESHIRELLIHLERENPFSREEEERQE